MKSTFYKTALILLIAIIGIDSFSQSTISKNQDKIVVLLDEFKPNDKRTASNYLGKKLAFQLPYLISLSLEKRNIQTEWYGDLFPDNISNMQNQLIYNTNELEADYIKKYKIDFGVKGDFIYDGTYNINIYVTKYNPEGINITDTFNLFVKNEKELELRLFYTSDDIYDFIIESKSSYKEKKIGVLAFKQIAKKNQPSDKYMGVDLSYAIYNESLYSATKKTNYQIINHIKDSLNVSYNEFLKNKKLDALISGNVIYLDDSFNIEIIPLLYIENKNYLIELPKLKTNTNNSYLIELTLYEMYSELLSELIIKKSKWDQALLKIIQDNDYNLLVDRINEYINKEKFFMAEILIDQLSKSSILNWKYYYYAGKIEKQKGNYNETIDLFKKSIKENPNKIEVYIELATQFKLIKDYSNALKIYMKAEKIEPNYTELNYLIGDVFATLKKYIRSNEYFNRQLKIDSTNYNAKLGIADNFYYASKTPNLPLNIIGKFNKKSVALADETIKNFMLDKEATNTCYQIYIRLGVSQYHDLKDIKMAYYTFKKAFDIFQNADTYDLMRICLTDLGEFDKIDSLIENGINNNIYTNDIYLTQGERFRIFTKENKTVNYYITALRYFNKYHELYPDNSIAIQKMGSVHFRMHQYDTALIYYNKAYTYEKDLVEKCWILLDITEVEIIHNSSKNALKTISKIEKILSQLSEVESIDIIILKQYLLVIAKHIENVDNDKDTIKLNELLVDNKFQGWDFSTFEKWTEQNTQLTDNDKSFILEVTNKVKGNLIAY